MPSVFTAAAILCAGELRQRTNINKIHMYIILNSKNDYFKLNVLVLG